MATANRPWNVSFLLRIATMHRAIFRTLNTMYSGRSPAKYAWPLSMVSPTSMSWKTMKSPKNQTPPRVEVVLVAVVAREVVRKEQGTEQVQGDGEQDDERVDLERPRFDVTEAEFPPPPKDRQDEHVEHPGEVNPIGSPRFGLLQAIRDGH